MRRIALYSHDAQGLGHMRRNIAIAQALAGAAPSSILLIAGAREAALFPLPEGTDTLTLPALGKGLDGVYRSRSLGLDLDEIVRLRAHSLCAALAAFEPDVLIVDKLPSGVEDELAHSFGLLEAMGTRLVLGLREVLDEPGRVRADWMRTDAMAVLRRHYHEVWIYGDQQVFDPVAEYGIPSDIAEVVRFSGYIDRLAAERTAEQAARRRRELELPDGHLSVCLLGGGEDGYRLADAFARCRMPEGSTGVVVTGPFMPEAEHAAIDALARDRDDLRVLGFVPDADTLVWLADEVVAMGGYNTSCEILACHKRALIVPRVIPRREQLIRAQRLSELGAVDVLHPEELTSDALSRWLAGGPRRPDLRTTEPIDMAGLRRLPGMLDDLLPAPSPPQRGALADVRLTVQSAIDGVPVRRARATDVAPAAGVMLRCLHEARLDGLEPARPDRLLRAAASAGELVAAVAPELAGRGRRIVERLEERMPRGLSIGPSHGDFNISQLIDVDGALALLDFDESSLAPPALDVSAYAANLVSGRPGDLDAAQRALDALLVGYGTRPEGVDWYLAATLTRRAPSPFKQHKRHWPERIASILDAAEAVLGA